jgi:hypothetical protein
VHRHAPEAQPVSSLARPLAVTGALIAAGVGVAYAAWRGLRRLFR